MTHPRSLDSTVFPRLPMTRWERALGHVRLACWKGLGLVVTMTAPFANAEEAASAPAAPVAPVAASSTEPGAAPASASASVSASTAAGSEAKGSATSVEQKSTMAADAAAAKPQNRFSLRLGGGGWRHNFGLVTLTGYSGGGGFLFERIQGPIHYLVSLEGMRVMQDVGGTDLQNSIVGGTGLGARDAGVGILMIGAGYQWQEAKLQPILHGRVGVAAGYDNTWVDVEVHVETTTVATNVFWGYDLDQTVSHSGPLVSPAFDLGVGIEPFKVAGRGAHFVPTLDMTYLPKNKTFALALNLQVGFP